MEWKWEHTRRDGVGFGARTHHPSLRPAPRNSRRSLSTRRTQYGTSKRKVQYISYHFRGPRGRGVLVLRRILYCMPGTARKHINTIVTGREELRFATVVAEDHPFLVDAKDDFENVCISPLARFRNYTENKRVKGRHLLSPLLGRFFTFLFVFLHTVRASWKSWPTPSRTTFV